MVMKLTSFYTNVVHIFFIALGTVVGGSIFAGIGAIITNQPPLKAMFDIARSIKIWALVAALGGTLPSFEIIEKGLFEGEFKSIIKQAIYVVSGLIGANVGYSVIKLIQRCGAIWGS